MLILLLTTCLLPFLLGDLIARFILVHPLIGIAFLIGWDALSFLLFMVVASYLGCILRKKLSKSQ